MQIQNEPCQNCQRFLALHPSGEISPNLVTLLARNDHAYVKQNASFSLMPTNAYAN